MLFTTHNTHALFVCGYAGKQTRGNGTGIWVYGEQIVGPFSHLENGGFVGIKGGLNWAKSTGGLVQQLFLSITHSVFDLTSYQLKRGLSFESGVSFTSNKISLISLNQSCVKTDD